jgi:hypothetical protein
MGNNSFEAIRRTGGNERTCFAMRAAASNAQMVQALELQHDQVATRLQEMNFRLESLANAMNRMEKSKRWI